MPRVVTLTTDFGTGSGYVAQMKGVLSHSRAAMTIVDIAHDVPAHDIRAAAWLVGQACFGFPPGSLHVVVVDPGVGTGRRLLWARIDGQEFLCPDNGVLSWALRRGALAAARAIEPPADAAPTFHGRDVLAPAAVSLLDGASPESLGEPTDRLVMLPLPEPRETPAGVEGEVLHVDGFGNLVTNLPAALWPRVIRSGGLRIGMLPVAVPVRTYGDAPAGTLVALVGSHGFIEAAVVEGRADRLLAGAVGTGVATG